MKLANAPRLTVALALGLFIATMWFPIPTSALNIFAVNHTAMTTDGLRSWWSGSGVKGFTNNTFLTTYFVSPTGSDMNTGLTPADPFLHIQHALDVAATAGDPDVTIQVAVGTYTEQLKITNNVTLIGAGAATTTIQAPGTLVADLGQRSIVEILSGATVTMSGFTVAGPGPGDPQRLNFGIFVIGNATLALSATTLLDIRDPLIAGHLSGTQNGVGIRVGHGPLSQVGHATIDGVTITGYQKNGMTIDGAGTTATVTNNTVTGAGLIPDIAQNGIQVSRGAVATLSGNTVSNNLCSAPGFGPDPVTEGGATGLLLFQAGGGTSIENNNVFNNDYGINDTSTGATTVTLNTFTSNRFQNVVAAEGTASVNNNVISGGNAGVLVIAFISATRDETGELLVPTLTASQAAVSANTISNVGKGVWILEEPTAAPVPVAMVTNNTISNNGTGVVVGASTASTAAGNTISQNQIFDNTSIGIDLANDGVTPNDPGDLDTGPNNLQNFPVITSATTAGVNGTLNSTPSTTFHIEVFSNAAADPSGFGEGETFVGAVDALTDGSGNATFTLAASLTPGRFITATATAPNPGTSEFSQPLVVSAPDIRVNDGQANEPAAGSAPMLFTIALSSPAPVSGVTVHYATADQTAVAGSDYNGVTDTLLTFAAGEQLKTVSVDILSDPDAGEPDETFLLNLSNSTGANIVDNQAIGTIKQAANAAGTFIISELRTSGPGTPTKPSHSKGRKVRGTLSAGSQPVSNNSFVELYNNSDSPVTVAASDASAGFGVFKMGADCNAAPILIGTVPNGTIIQARGHYLLAGSSYSLSAAAAGDQTMTVDLGPDQNLAVFTTNDPGNISSVTRLDAVGFGTNTGNNCDLLREGTTLAALDGSGLEYSFFRDSCGKGGNVNMMGLCPSGGRLVDMNNNATDFLFADTSGASTTAGQRLGVPGPENLTSPIEHNSTIFERLLDPLVPKTVSPNRLRDMTSDPMNNATFGTLTVNRTFTNNTGSPVTRLRFRIIDVTAFPVTGALADLRAMSSSDMVLPVTGGGMVTVRGTTLETQVPLPVGGAMNSTLSADTITLANPLANGGSVSLQFKLGVQKPGSFKFWVNLEALP